MENQKVRAVKRSGADNSSLMSTSDLLHPWLALLGITAIFCLNFELEMLAQLDSLSLYLTAREIALDGIVALSVVLGVAVLWWAAMVALAQIVTLIPQLSRGRAFILWRFGLLVPLSYLVFTLFNAIRLAFWPAWHPSLIEWICFSALLVVMLVGSFMRVGIPKLIRFSRVKLAPVAWLHIITVAVGVCLLWSDGVYLFRDYVHTTAPSATQLPDVYLITIDALRAKDMSLYGYDRATTPNLQRFSEHAFVFDSFFAASNFTTPSTTSIETGKLPWHHRVFHLGGFLRGPAQKQDLAALMRDRGYYTATISSNFLASPILHRSMSNYDAAEFVVPVTSAGKASEYSNLVGLDTLYTLAGGFLGQWAGLMFYADTWCWRDGYWAPAEPVFDRARDLLERRDIAQPRFLWAHILPPHDPYVSPAPYQGRFLQSSKLKHNYDFIGYRYHSPPAGTTRAELKARYDETISYADQVVGDFLDWLDHTGRLENAIVIISADHGESFEHDWLKHSGPHLYEGLIHIPLMIHLPGQKDGRRITQSAEQVDLLPTILDLTGGRIPDWTDGVSLKPALEGKPLPARYLFSMNLEPNSVFAPVSKGTVAVLDEEYKYVNYLDMHREVLYRYRTDPDENNDLSSTQAAELNRMREVFKQKLAEVNQQFTPRH